MWVLLWVVWYIWVSLTFFTGGLPQSYVSQMPTLNTALPSLISPIKTPFTPFPSTLKLLAMFSLRKTCAATTGERFMHKTIPLFHKKPPSHQFSIPDSSHLIAKLTPLAHHLLHGLVCLCWVTAPPVGLTHTQSCGSGWTGRVHTSPGALLTHPHTLPKHS